MRTTPWQLFRFAYIYLYSQSAIFLIPTLIRTSGYQGWMSVLGGFVLSSVILWCTYAVGRLGRDQPWHVFGKEIVGKWMHKLFLFLMICWFVYYSALELENFSKFFGSVYMRETPPWAIIIIISIAVYYTCRLGFATLVYMSEGVFLMTLPIIGVLVVLFYPHADYRMLPALIHYHNPGLVWKDSFSVMSWLAEWLTFLFIAPEFKFDRKTLKNLFLAEVMTITALLLGWFFILLSFRPYLGGQEEYPYLELIRGSSQAGIMGNTDTFFIAIWTTSMFIHNSFLIYAASKCARQLFGIKKFRGITEIMVICSVIVACLYSRNPTLFLLHYNAPWMAYIFIAFECIPAYYYLVSLLRWRKFKKAAAGEQPTG